MGNKNNKNTSTYSEKGRDIVVETKNGSVYTVAKTPLSERIVTEFVSDFYVKYGRIMTKLAYE